MAFKKGKTLAPGTKHKSGIVYWLRFGLAILSGLFCAFLGLGLEGLAVGPLLYLISYILTLYVIEPSINLGRYEVYLLGLGTYLVTWLTFWILINTLLGFS